MNICESIKIIRDINNKKINNLEIGLEEYVKEKEAYKCLFDRMQNHINVLIQKKNYLPGMTDKDIEQELKLHLIDVILPRKSKRIRINKITGEKNIMKTSVNINQDYNKVESYLKLSLSHKYYRISRDYYVYDKKTIKEFEKIKSEGKQCKGMIKTFKDPLNNFCFTLENENENNDVGTINEDRIFIEKNNNEDCLIDLEINFINERISKEARELLILALGCNKPIDFNKYIKNRGDAKYTLEHELVPVLEKYYGITRQNFKRNRRKKQNTKEIICNS